jgi:beta-mannanase
MKAVAASALAIALVSPLLLFAIPKTETPPRVKLYQVNYNVADLPVWRSNLKDAPRFAPEVLTTHLRSTIDPASWSNGATIRPFARNASLVIAQSKANHAKIADALKAFRESDPREVEEVIAR